MIDLAQIKENIMKVKDIIREYHMPCSSIQDLYEREEILEMEAMIKRMEQQIDEMEYLDITEYSHSNGHPAYEE